MSQILGPDGRPVKSTSLTKPQAEPQVAGIRSPWHEPIASGLTPPRLASILRAAAEGEMRDFLILAEEMEEREPHYFSVLSTRKRALTELAPIITAPTDDAGDVKIADAVRELVEDPRFTLMIGDLTDAIGKGYSVVELIWSRSSTRWDIAGYEWRDPTFFTFDRRTGAGLRLASSDAEGVPLAPYTFITHFPRLKSGLPGRGGLARLAVWSFMLKSFTLKDWMAFLEIYGMPFRIGKYGPGATNEEKDALLRAVRDIAGDAAAIMPDSMSVDFVESKASTGSNAFESKARYIDEQLSKIVLGQTTTTDAISGGHAVSKEHNEVRHDILRSDSRVLAATLQRDLIEPYVAFNFGPQERYPRLSYPVEEGEDLKALMENTERYVRLGGKVSSSEVRDKLGWSDPGEEDELLAAPRSGAEAAPAVPIETAPPPARARALHPVCPGCGQRHAPALAARLPPADDDLTAIMVETFGDWVEAADPIFTPLREALEAASSYEELNAALAGALAKMDRGALAEALARATAKARGLGDIKD